VDGKSLTAVVRMLLYTEEASAVLPPLMRRAHQGDLAPLAAQLFAAERLGDEIEPAMQLSVVCAEDVPFYAPKESRPNRAGSATAKPPVFPDARAELETACAKWPHATVDPIFHAPKTSTTPALLLSGEADPVTPPARALQALASLPNNRHVVVPGTGHGNFFRGCVPRIVRSFLEDPESVARKGPPDKILDISCAQKMGPLPAFLDEMGPAP
jgi:pimeloyl-ACP methyl ester carboxylesterase